MRVYLSFVVVIFLSGCATGLYEKDKNQALTALGQTAEVCGLRDDSGAKKRLLGKIYANNFSVNAAPFPADSTYVSQDDYLDVYQAALTELGCKPLFDAWVGAHAKSAQPAVDNYFANQRDIFADLLGKKVTYGEAKARLKWLPRAFFGDLSALEQHKLEENQRSFDLYLSMFLHGAFNGPSPQMQPMNRTGP